MSEYTAEIVWTREQQAFLDNRYSRRHVIRFDGGSEVPGSSSPHVVPVPYSEKTAVDPEEMLVASLSSCHLLWFLSIAVKHKFVVDRYEDSAVGVMSKNEEGKLWMSRVTLRPKVTFADERQPTREQLEGMHHAAHTQCYIANSVKTEIACEPIPA